MEIVAQLKKGAHFLFPPVHIIFAVVILTFKFDTIQFCFKGASEEWSSDDG